MAVIGNIFLVLCLLASLNQVYPSVLSREILVDQSPRVAFKDVLAQIRNTDVRGEAVKMVFSNAEKSFSSLTDLLAAKSNPEVFEVLDIFNINFGVKLLVVNGDSIQVDPSAYQRLLSDKAMSLVKSVFPNNVVQQLMFYGASQRQIKRTCQAIRPEIESRKVPLEKMTALIASNGFQISKRDIWSDLVTSVETSVCNTLVSYAFTQVNTTLTSITDFLDTITLSSGNNVLVALVSFVLDYVEEVVEGFRDIAESFTSSICSEIFSSSRKRRDVGDTELAELGSRDIQTRDLFSSLFDVVWWLISGILNSTLKNLWDSLISTIESYFATLLEGTITDWVYAVIDSVFS